MEYCVSFAKIRLDKEGGVLLEGLYFGGICHSVDEAEEIARECVNNTKGCTAIPAIIEIDEDDMLLDKLDESYDRFKKKAVQMQEAYDILSRPTRKKSK